MAKVTAPKIDYDAFWNLGMASIRELESDRGILASHKSEMYGCIFGRDSLITALLLLEVYKGSRDPYLLALVRKILHNLTLLQGKRFNIESGEEPGKCIHEYRVSGHEHLTRDHNPPWYLYPDGAMRNYDTVDATHLLLIAFQEYLKASEDKQFIEEHILSIRFALSWVLQYADTNEDGLFDYTFRSGRTYGGLVTQSWMDSTESTFFEKSKVEPEYPIAPVEVQGYAFSALHHWGTYFAETDPKLAETLKAKADRLQEEFNNRFIVPRGSATRLAFALDGTGKQMRSSRSSMGHVLWSCWDDPIINERRSVLQPEHIPGLVKRLMRKDIFVPKAGLRTLSTRSSGFEPNSYHNGSIWPHDTVMVALGFERFGYTEEAHRVYRALMRAYKRFVSPIELFTFQRTHRPYVGQNGQHACQMQAWSAAALLVIVQRLRG